MVPTVGLHAHVMSCNSLETAYLQKMQLIENSVVRFTCHHEDKTQHQHPISDKIHKMQILVKSSGSVEGAAEHSRHKHTQVRLLQFQKSHIL